MLVYSWCRLIKVVALERLPNITRTPSEEVVVTVDFNNRPTTGSSEKQTETEYPTHFRIRCLPDGYPPREIIGFSTYK